MAQYREIMRLQDYEITRLRDYEITRLRDYELRDYKIAGYKQKINTQLFEYN
jgi:hypothetical protein